MGKVAGPRNIKREAVKGLIALVVIVGALLAVKFKFTPKEGERCKDSVWGCASGTKCVGGPTGHRCRKMCTSDRDCTRPKECKPVIVIGGGPNADESACL
jgi:hypothetical protein